MSSVIRIIIGIAIVAAVIVIYSKNSAQIAAGGQVRIFGISVGGAGWLIPAFIVVGAIGLVFAAAGVVGLLRNRK